MYSINSRWLAQHLVLLRNVYSALLGDVSQRFLNTNAPPLRLIFAKPLSSLATLRLMLTMANLATVLINQPVAKVGLS